MVGGAAARAGTPAGHALDYRLVGYLDGQRAVDVYAPGLKGLRLGMVLGMPSRM